MSLIDEIRENAKNGTPGIWEAPCDDEAPVGMGLWVENIFLPLAGNEDDTLMTTADARRIAAVPRMEAAVLAAEECAAALEAAYTFIFDEYYQASQNDGEFLPLKAREPIGKITEALAAFREACK